MGENKQLQAGSDIAGEGSRKKSYKTTELVLRMGTSTLKMVPKANPEADEPEPLPTSFSKFLLNSPMARSELTIQRDFYRERFIEIQE